MEYYLAYIIYYLSAQGNCHWFFFPEGELQESSENDLVLFNI